VISKVFEALLLTIFHDELETNELQFGFKPGISCSDVVFSVKTVINYFVERGSSVYASTLDLRKAFDCVNHYKIYKSMLKAGIPLPTVDIVHCWYNKVLVSVRWNNYFSECFHVSCGVRQSSPLSPYLFNLFVDILMFTFICLQTEYNIIQIE